MPISNLMAFIYIVFLSGKFSLVLSLRSNQFGLIGFEPNFEKDFLMHKLDSLKWKESDRRHIQQYVLLKNHKKIVYHLTLCPNSQDMKHH